MRALRSALHCSPSVQLRALEAALKQAEDAEVAALSRSDQRVLLFTFFNLLPELRLRTMEGCM